MEIMIMVENPYKMFVFISVGIKMRAANKSSINQKELVWR